RADSQEKLKLRQQEVENLGKKVEAARNEKATADDQRQIHEEKERAFRDAKTALETANNSLELALQKKREDQQRVGESQEACETVKTNELAYETHVRAEQELRRLQEEQNEKAQFQRLYAHASNQKTEWQGKADAGTRRRRADRQGGENPREETRRGAEAQRDVVRTTGADQRRRLSVSQGEVSAIRSQENPVGCLGPGAGKQFPDQGARPGCRGARAGKSASGKACQRGGQAHAIE